MMKNQQLEKFRYSGMCRSVVLVGIILLLLGGCSSTRNKAETNDLAATILDKPLVVPSAMTNSKAQRNCGNEPGYTLNGKTYQVMASAQGYRAEGVASWYGAEYQGTETAGCEIFDMHAFSAAHRTLPLPSFVRVTNLKNNKSVIVRVNDRGPFGNNGLIELSFAAANTLGMTRGSRVARVRVEALSAQQQANAKLPVSRPAAQSKSRAALRVKQPSSAQQAAINRAKQRGKSFFVVVKNYQDQAAALDMFVRLTSVGLNKTEMASAVSNGRKVHQVRIGPLYTQDQIDNVSDALENNGLATFKVVEVNN